MLLFSREGKPEIEKPQLKATAASTDLTTIKQSELLKAVSKSHAEKIVLKEAPPEYEFIADPPSISGLCITFYNLALSVI